MKQELKNQLNRNSCRSAIAYIEQLESELRSHKDCISNMQGERDALAAHMTVIQMYFARCSLRQLTDDPAISTSFIQLIEDPQITTSLAEHDQELISRERKRWAREDVEALKERDRKGFIAGSGALRERLNSDLSKSDVEFILDSAQLYAEKNARGEV